MIASTQALAELAKAGSNLVTTSARVSEMMAASGSVISARMTILGNAAHRPAEGDYAELGGMMQEKVVAIAKVNQALVEQGWAMVADTTEQARHLVRLMFAGHPLSAADLSGLADRWMAHGTRMITRSMDIGGLALAPVHQQATANARRLRNKD